LSSPSAISIPAQGIRVIGELDLAVADQLRDAIERSHAAEILISLEDCEFIDSSGIAVILRAHHAAANGGGGGRVVMHSPRRQVLRVLEISGLASNGLVFESREAALGEAFLGLGMDATLEILAERLGHPVPEGWEAELDVAVRNGFRRPS
jgi:anti-anti-sigma factor